MSGLDVVIVNWNTGGQLAPLPRIDRRGVAGGLDLWRVVVVDNASTDGSADGLGSPALPLTLLRNGRNRGFAAACNAGEARQRRRLPALPQSRYAALPRCRGGGVRRVGVDARARRPYHRFVLRAVGRIAARDGARLFMLYRALPRVMRGLSVDGRAA